MPRRAQAGGNSQSNALPFNLTGAGGAFVIDDSIEDDPELLAELAALEEEERPRRAPQPPANQRRAAPTNQRAANDLDSVLRAAVQLSNCDDVTLDDADEASLEHELDGLLDEPARAPPPRPARTAPAAPFGSAQSGGGDQTATIQSRIETYRTALQNAKAAGEASRVRRFNRGLTTLNDQLKRAKRGERIAESELPPAVSVKTQGGPPHKNSLTNSDRNQFLEIQRQVSQSKSDSNLDQRASEAEREPPPPPPPKPPAPSLIDFDDSPPPQIKVSSEEKRRSGTYGLLEDDSAYQVTDCDPKPSVTAIKPNRDASPKPPLSGDTRVPSKPSDSTQTSAKPSVATTSKSPLKQPATTAEALAQRLEKYVTAAEEAHKEDNANKKRRMMRIAKQYQDAIKAHKTGRPVDFDSLPELPGFPPIPRPKATVTQLPAVTPPRQPGATVTPPRAAGTAAGGPTPPKQSRNTQQLAFLLQRQAAFKHAAVEAKKKGDIETAKSLLVQSKGFDSMIHAARNGLPVNIAKCPRPPVSKDDDLQPTMSTRHASSSGLGTQKASTTSIVVEGQDDASVFASLEADLIRQYQLAARAAEHFTRVGDVPHATRFDKDCNSLKADLLALRNAKMYEDPPPRFRYVERTLPSLVALCCPDVPENEWHLTLVRAMNVPQPEGYEEKHMSIFVRYSLPLPSTEQAQTGKSDPPVSGTNSPRFDYTDKLKINRRSKTLLRAVANKQIKFELFQKGGFMRSDKLLANAAVPLAALVNNTMLHSCVDLQEGRKKIGGKLEVKIRQRTPLSQDSGSAGNAVEKHKWLVIDEFVRRNHKPRRTEL